VRAAGPEGPGSGRGHGLRLFRIPSSFAYPLAIRRAGALGYPFCVYNSVKYTPPSVMWRLSFRARYRAVIEGVTVNRIAERDLPHSPKDFNRAINRLSRETPAPPRAFKSPVDSGNHTRSTIRSRPGREPRYYPLHSQSRLRNAVRTHELREFPPRNGLASQI